MEKSSFEKLMTAGYLVMATLQVVATWQGLEQSSGMPRALAMVGGGVVGAVPILGSITGLWGAMAAWGWSFLPSLLIFFWYVPAVLIAAAFDARRRSRKRPA
jgi:hypothetical protein